MYFNRNGSPLDDQTLSHETHNIRKPFSTSNLQNQHKTKHMHTSNTNFGGVGPFGIALVKQSIQFRLGSAV